MGSTPGTKRQSPSGQPARRHCHRRHQGRDSEKPTAKTDHQRTGEKDRRRVHRRRKDHGRKRHDPGKYTAARHAIGVGAPRQHPRGKTKAQQRPDGPHRGQCRGGCDRQAQNLAAIGFQQHVLHIESDRTQKDHGQQTASSATRHQISPGIGKFGARCFAFRFAHGANLFLLPQRDDVQRKTDNRGPLHDPDQLEAGEILQQETDDQGGCPHAQKEHDIEQRHNAGPRLIRGAITGQGQPCRLGHVQAKSRHQKGQRRQNLTREGNAVDNIAT